MKFGKSFVAIFVGCLVMSGCARTASVDPRPDEFAVLPNAALVEPANYTDLPEPGTTSRAALNPISTASIALGGSGAVNPPQVATQKNAFSGFFGRLFGNSKSNAELLGFW